MLYGFSVTKKSIIRFLRLKHKIIKPIIMKLYTAIVLSQFDPLDPTIIWCRIIGSDLDVDEGVPVLYTSPVNRTHAKGGLTAYPMRGDLVLIASADNDASLFYLSTVTGISKDKLEQGIDNYPSDEKLMSHDIAKRSISLRDNIGGVIELVDKSSDLVRKSYVKLANGPESITLNRQYQNESIHLRTRGGDTQIRMNGPRKFSGVDHGPGSLLVQGERNTVLKTKKGNLRVEAAAEARSIMIKNNAYFVGLNANASDPFSGSVSIESLHNQICLRTYGFGIPSPGAPYPSNPWSGIYLQAGLLPGPVPSPAPIPPTAGVIQSHAAMTNQMLCGEGAGFGISMDNITQTMTIQAPGGININTGGALNLNGTAVNLQLPTNVYPGATPIVPRPTNLDAQPPKNA